MILRISILTLFAISFYVKGLSQTSNELIYSANDLYKKQEFEKAENAYDKIIEKDRYNTTAKFNLANTYFRRSKKDDAVKAFDFLTSDGQPSDLRERSYYNKGVVLSRQEKLEESIESYKNALRLNPSDTSARENLQKALFELKKKQPPPKKEEPKPKKQQDQKKQNQQQQKMNQKEAEQRLQMMEQKEKQVMQRMQNEKSKSSSNVVAKDW
ncbi:MAG: tetratricopeptide repeat protein [Bacteroidetes bacterium]|nr:tetratricopeptide repeat protein [Bacteroidota bacterium]